MMDTQVAITPSGLLHAVSCVQNDQDARRFQTVMESQGFRVERLSSAVAAVRFAQPTRPTNAPERPAQKPLPELGTRICFSADQRQLTGSVAAVLRWPADHPYCPGRVAVLARVPGWEGLVDPHTALPVTEVQQPAPPAGRTDPLPPQAAALTHPPTPPPDAWVQQGLW